jgi:hypothetical protein
MWAEPECYRANSHYFAACGPSIFSAFARRRRPAPPISESAVIPDAPAPAPPPRLALSAAAWCIDQPESVAPPPPPPAPPAPQKSRNLSPATLGQLLTAEFDHFLQVERDIAEIAGVEANVETARHEHRLANECVFDGESEELAELARLDHEIARLEMVLEQKMAADATATASYTED